MPPRQAVVHYLAMTLVVVATAAGLWWLPQYLSWTSPFSPPVRVGAPEAEVVARYGPPRATYDVADLDRVPGLFDGGTRWFRAADMPEMPGMHHALFYTDGNHRSALVVVDHQGLVLWTLFGHLE